MVIMVIALVLMEINYYKIIDSKTWDFLSVTINKLNFSDFS